MFNNFECAYATVIFSSLDYILVLFHVRIIKFHTFVSPENDSVRADFENDDSVATIGLKGLTCC